MPWFGVPEGVQRYGERRGLLIAKRLKIKEKGLKKRPFSTCVQKIIFMMLLV